MAFSRLVALFSTLALVFSSYDGGGFWNDGGGGLCVVSSDWLQARGELRLNPISAYLLAVVEGRFTHSYRVVSSVLWIGTGSHGVGDEGWSILRGGVRGERVGVGILDLNLARIKAWSTCAMLNPTGSAFILPSWSSDGVDAYQRWLLKNPGLTGKAISGATVVDGDAEFLGALGLNSAVLGLKVWALGLLSLVWIFSGLSCYGVDGRGRRPQRYLLCVGWL